MNAGVPNQPMGRIAPATEREGMTDRTVTSIILAQELASVVITINVRPYHSTTAEENFNKAIIAAITFDCTP